MDPDARALIDRFGMEPIPVEGGWFTRTWRSAAVVSVGGRSGQRASKPLGTAILALFCDAPEGFSALHRLPTTELWHFCGGDPFELLLLHPGGRSELLTLGPHPLGGDEVQVAVPARTWMGGRVVPGGRFSLLGCTMAPGFTDDDLEIGSPDLAGAYPDRAAEIARLTRR